MKCTLVDKTRDKKTLHSREYWKLRFRGENNEKIMINTTNEFFRQILMGDVVEMSFTITKQVGSVIWAKSPKNMVLVSKNELMHNHVKGIV
jgi:hypothetical protein